MSSLVRFRDTSDFLREPYVKDDVFQGMKDKYNSREYETDIFFVLDDLILKGNHLRFIHGSLHIHDVK